MATPNSDRSEPAHRAATGKRVVLAITGASGAVYAVRLLHQLLAAQCDVHVVISPSGAAVILQELSIKLDVDAKPPKIDALISDEAIVGLRKTPNLAAEYAAAIEHKRLHVYHYQDYFTPVASGSFLTDAMVVCPCSGGTLSSIVRSNSGNLIERAAEVHLKERRPLIVVPRETPLSTFQIENMLRASQAGIVVLPAAPGWYHGVTEMADLVDFVVARILDQLRIEHHLMQRWQADL